jgi:hypothetical protein
MARSGVQLPGQCPDLFALFHPEQHVRSEVFPDFPIMEPPAERGTEYCFQEDVFGKPGHCIENCGVGRIMVMGIFEGGLWLRGLWPVTRHESPVDCQTGNGQYGKVTFCFFQLNGRRGEMQEGSGHSFSAESIIESSPV